ncbi:hypothetical protein ACFS2C_03750 [Prauserella oleivorans]|uniref:Uncharacterized protein n=1 Tax=Prauserella oleivorans TaxID=1478153 RepID=A0ABW5W7D2_9PSEU
MVDVHDDPPKDGFAVPLRLHNVLLGLAGRLDDSALSEARELVARSHLDDAAELAVGALIAGRIMVRPAEQRELALVLELSRSDATLADQLTVGEDVPGYAHRFSRDDEPERGVAEALERTLLVLPDLRSVHAVWRNTPAGSVPGPLPQRVVLVDIGPEAHPPAVAFRVEDALRKAGVRAVVEVTGPGAERTDYHEAALAAATLVWLGGPESVRTSSSWSSVPARGQHAATGAHAAVEEARTPSQAGPDFDDPAVKVSRRSSDEADEAGEAGDVVEAGESDDPDAAAAEPVETAAEPETAEAELENRSAETTEMSREEVAQLRAAIAEDPDKGRAIASVNLRSEESVDLPELDLDDPNLSERDRQLLRELHAELAERERAEAARTRANGVEHRWSEGYSGT